MPNFYRKLVSVQKNPKKTHRSRFKKKFKSKQKVSYWDTPTTGYREVMELNQTASLGECDYAQMFKILDYC